MVTSPFSGDEEGRRVREKKTLARQRRVKLIIPTL
jgi:hypothetical protein